MKRVFAFVRKETVLSVAMILAIISAFLVHPDKEYLSYIDFRTLVILFSLMTVMAGFRELGLFAGLAKKLISRAGRLYQVILILVLLCFFTSMIITNDVALITFVPFSFTVLSLAGEHILSKWIIPTVCMQTVAANLGSMLTPLGNPQNLYLYGKAQMSFSEFIKLMLPYTGISLALILVWIIIQSLSDKENRRAGMGKTAREEKGPSGKKILWGIYGVLFVISLLCVMRVIPYLVLLGVTVLLVVLFEPAILKKVDYSLLLTFVGFFIFIGNLGRIEALSSWMEMVVGKNTVLTAVLASQVTSNVPAALLLSGFTMDYKSLIIGTNLGGLGTLIASMASLISYRQIAREMPNLKGRYFLVFTISNVVLLAMIYLFAYCFLL